MSFFTKILNKLGIGKDASEAPEFAGMSKPAGVVKGTMPAQAPAKPAATAPMAPRPGKEKDDAMERLADAGPKAMSEVDVVSKLEALATANPAKLNWKVSIVDLLKLLDLNLVSKPARNLRPSWAARPT